MSGAFSARHREVHRRGPRLNDFDTVPTRSRHSELLARAHAISRALDEILARPVPRSFDARVHLANPRRALLGSCVVAAFIGALAAGILTSTGSLTNEVIEAQLLVFSFFGVLLLIPPAWQLSNYRRARRLLTYGTVVPATVSLGTPTRGHPWPPAHVTFESNGARRSLQFATGADFRAVDGAAVLVLGKDAGLYLPGLGLVSARVR